MVVFGTIPKLLFRSHFGRTRLEKRATMATFKVSVDEKLSEIVCYMSIFKVRKFRRSMSNRF